MKPPFREQAAAYKKLIDHDIAAYAAQIRRSTREQYGEPSGQVTDAFLDLLAGEGKRLRATLVLVGYEMSGGTDQKMILQAARAIEMLHAYILIIDDIQDRSATRRGRPAAHHALQAMAPGENSAHIGLSLALDAALTGNHAAQMILANLDAPSELRLRAISITNRTMLIVGHGQTHDLLQQFAPQPSEAAIEQVMDWKAALYTFINPLHVGMVLAGADCQATDAITPYARHAGLAFQITDDLLGIFGDPKHTGKPAGDDLREGKRTLLINYALEQAALSDAAFLRGCLGKTNLTAHDLGRAQKILEATRARQFAVAQAQAHVEQALTALQAEARRWPPAQVAFLRQLALQLGQRTH